MGEARRRSEKGLSKKTFNSNKKKEDKKKIISWLPTTTEQEQLFINFSIKGAWIGIFLLVALWLVVRLIGPYFGWWTPADLR